MEGHCGESTSEKIHRQRRGTKKFRHDVIWKEYADAVERRKARQTDLDRAIEHEHKMAVALHEAALELKR